MCCNRRPLLRTFVLALMLPALSGCVSYTFRQAMPSSHPIGADPPRAAARSFGEACGWNVLGLFGDGIGRYAEAYSAATRARRGAVLTNVAVEERSTFYIIAAERCLIVSGELTQEARH